MQEHEVIERIKALCESRGWTNYRLAKESGIYENAAITPEQREHLQLWDSLSEENRAAAEKYLRFLLSEQSLL